MNEKHEFDGLCNLPSCGVRHGTCFARRANGYCGLPASDPIHSQGAVPETAGSSGELRDDYDVVTRSSDNYARIDVEPSSTTPAAPPPGQAGHSIPAAPPEAPKATPLTTRAQTPCCGYTWQAKGDPGPIFWNQYNRAVQCHNCGQVFVPLEVSNGDSL